MSSLHDFDTSTNSNTGTPSDLLIAPESFWALPPDFEALAGEMPAAGAEILEMLGPPPFPRTGFPFIGFLATVYDHVAEHIGGGRRDDSPG